MIPSMKIRPAIVFPVTLIFILVLLVHNTFILVILGGSSSKGFTALLPSDANRSLRIKLSKQPGKVHQSCWQCIQPSWRRHFIFGNATTGHLDVCPDSSSWPPGAWTQPIISAGSVHLAVGAPQPLQPPKHAKPAALGEAAVLPATLMAQKAIEANQMSADCNQAKLVVYQAVHR